MRGVILVVEDDAVQRRAMQRMLVGRDIRSVRCAEDAIRILAGDEEIEVALIDIGLPGFTGLELLAHIQTTRPQLPVIIVSGHNKPEYINLACRLGARYLVKPINREDLQVAVAHYSTRDADPEPPQSTKLSRAYGLSKRESEVLSLSLRGFRRDVIRERLGISESNVKKIVTRLLRKCGATSLRDLAEGQVGGKAE